MSRTTYELDDSNGGFSEAAVLDPTARWGDWERHVEFDEVEHTTTDKPTGKLLEAKIALDEPVATRTRVV
jgi:hypothetical protein